jgi:hypothetical protein
MERVRLGRECSMAWLDFYRERKVERDAEGRE